MNICVNGMMYIVQCTVSSCMNKDAEYVCGEHCALYDLCPQTFNEHHLRRSLKTLMSYSESDRAMEECNFPEQVRTLFSWDTCLNSPVYRVEMLTCFALLCLGLYR